MNFKITALILILVLMTLTNVHAATLASKSTATSTATRTATAYMTPSALTPTMTPEFYIIKTKVALSEIGRKGFSNDIVESTVGINYEYTKSDVYAVIITKKKSYETLKTRLESDAKIIITSTRALSSQESAALK